MVPGLVKFFPDNDFIVKITVNNLRYLLYVLTEKDVIEAWNIGKDKQATRRIALISRNDIVHQASNVLK